MKMQAPKDCSSMSFGGIEVKTDKDGNIDVPESHIQDAKDHGCTELKKAAAPAKQDAPAK